MPSLWVNFFYKKLREDFVILACLVWIQYQHVTDRQTWRPWLLQHFA